LHDNDDAPARMIFKQSEERPMSMFRIGSTLVAFAVCAALSCGTAASVAGADRPADDDAYGPSRLSIRPEEREPAASVPVGRIRTDAAGKPVGQVEIYSGAQTLPPDAPPATPEARDPFPSATPEARKPSPPATSEARDPSPPATPEDRSVPAPGDAGAAFVPPTAPGPFGAHRSPQGDIPAGAGRPGVTPLRDMRPQPAEDPLVYVAPGHAPSEQEDEARNYGGKRDDAAPDGATGATRMSAAGRDVGPDAGKAVGAEAARLLGLVNNARAAGRRCGDDVLPPAPPLAENPAITALAQRHAAAMTAGRFFSSTTPAGVTLGQRLTAAGYNWSFAAENIAHMDGTAEGVLYSWLSIENRCRNLMGAEYMEAGAGYDPVGRNWVFTLTTPMP
jgi:uncharacterized protein YkwD